MTTTPRTSLVETVQSMYAAFGRGDIISLLAALHPNVEWSINVDPHAPGARIVPLFRVFTGANDVANFFAYLSRDFEVHSFEPVGFLVNSSEVASRVLIDMTIRPTHRRLRLESIHLFTFNAEGRVIRFREFSDTLAATAAWGGI